MHATANAPRGLETRGPSIGRPKIVCCSYSEFIRIYINRTRIFMCKFLTAELSF
jgi:hypothetical protein